MFGLGTKELIIIAIVLVLLFGSKKIPELAQSIVQAVKHLRTAFKDDDVAGKVNVTTNVIKKK